MQIKRLAIHIILGFSLTLSVHAQTSCTESLLSAQRLYNEGIIEEIPAIINPCIDNGFTRSERVEAYKLLILAYLFDDNQFEAENTITKFLREFPDYELMPNDPIEFVYFYKTFKVIPKFSFGFSAGANYSNPHVTQYYTTGNANDMQSNDKWGFGYNLNFNISAYAKGRYGFNLGVNYGMQSYSFEDEIYNFTKTTVQESITRITTPVSFTFDLTTDKVIPYVRIGVAGTFLQTATATPQRDFLNLEESPITGADINLISKREFFNISAQPGVGLKIKSGKGFIFFDARYNYHLFNEVISTKRYDNQELWVKYYFLEDDFKVMSIDLSVGYNFTIFKAIKN